MSAAAQRLANRTAIPFVALCVLIIAALGVAYLSVDPGFDDFVGWSCLAIFYFLLAGCLFRPITIYNNIKTYFTIELVFLISYYISFYYPYQIALLDSLDIVRSTYFNHTYAAESNRAIILTTVGAIAFVAGIRRLPSQSLELRNSVWRNWPIPGLHAATLALLLGLIAVYYLAGWRSESVGRYTDTAAGGAAANGVYNLIIMFCIITVVECVRALNARRMGFALSVAAAVTLAWSIIILIDGDRNSFFLIAIAALGGLLTYCIRGSRLIILASLVISIMLYNSVEVLRTSETRSIGELAELVVFGDPDASARDSSFTITSITLRASLRIAPEREEFGYGEYQMIGAAGLVPFIRGALWADAEFTDTSQVLNHYILGRNAAWSVGTNLISDIYFDFGVVGVPVVLFALGWFASAMQTHAATSPQSPSARILYLMTLTFFAEYPRYALSMPITTLAWTALFLFFLRAVVTPWDRHYAHASVRDARQRSRGTEYE